MAIVDEIERIKTNIANAYTALEEKGATLPTERNSDNLSAVIVEVPTGGGGGDEELTNSFISLVDNTLGANCTKLPEGITSIGEYAFYRRTNLALTKLPNTVHYFYKYCFAYCTNLNIHEIGPSTKIDGVALGIGSYAFQYSGLTDIKLAEGIATLPQNAFEYCNKLTKVDLPSTITSLSTNVFKGCTNLKTVICRANTVPTLQSSSIPSSIVEEIYVPDDRVEAYKIKTNWSTFSSRIKPLSEYGG